MNIEINGEAKFKNGVVSFDILENSSVELGKSNIQFKNKAGGFQAILDQLTLGLGENSTFSISPEHPDASFGIQLSGANVIANFGEGTSYNFTKGIQGKLKVGSFIKLVDISSRFESKERKPDEQSEGPAINIKGFADVNLDFQKGTVFSFDNLSFKADSLNPRLSGKFEYGDAGISFTTGQNELSSISIGNSVATRITKQAAGSDALKAVLNSFDAKVTSARYEFNLKDDIGIFDFKLNASAEMKKTIFSQNDKNTSFVASAEGLSLIHI